jgi:hypothetical protein
MAFCADHEKELTLPTRLVTPARRWSPGGYGSTPLTMRFGDQLFRVTLDAHPGGAEQVIPLLEETLVIGKRVVNRGTTRV